MRFIWLAALRTEGAPVGSDSGNGDGWDHDKSMTDRTGSKRQKKGELCVAPLMTTLKMAFFLSKGTPPVP